MSLNFARSYCNFVQVIELVTLVLAICVSMCTGNLYDKRNLVHIIVIVAGMRSVQVFLSPLEMEWY